MTREEKDLLLRDLCARLPYGVKIHYTKHPDSPIDEDVDDTVQGYYCNLVVGEKADYCLDRCRLYLRPMSSMTEEERDEYRGLQHDVWHSSTQPIYYDSVDSIDWLNAHHFDYRGLIGKGLAIEVIDENNPYI